MAQGPVYLDYNATTPCDPVVLETMLPYFSQFFGNAASRHHAFGWRAEAAVDLAREQVATLIGAEPGEIVFTSGATESVNLALKGVAEAYASKGNHIISSTIEHKAVLDVLKDLQKKGVEVSWLSVDPGGRIDPEELEAAIRPDTILISLMFANNELGTMMPVPQIGQIAKKHGVLFFTDATQAVGKVPVDVSTMGIDLLALSAHKFYGPKGAGAIYVRRKNPRVKLISQMQGGGHQKGLRSGTLNVPGIAGLGKAAEVSEKLMGDEVLRISALRNRLEEALLALGAVHINGNRENRLPNTTNLSFSGVEGEALMMALKNDIAVSSGSACTSASLEPSYVLKAIGLSDELAYSSLRFSLGRFTTEEEIRYSVEKIRDAVRNLRVMNPVVN